MFAFIFLQVDFGEVFIPPGLDVPRPRVLPEFKRLAHGLRSSNVSVLDAKTFYVRIFLSSVKFKNIEQNLG